MPSENKQPIRLSQRRIRSNPILEGERVYRQDLLLRDKERRQLARLLELQSDGVSIYCVPEFKRLEGNELKISDERIGVVGLLADNTGIGLVTRIKASPHACWEISIDLPFKQAHIQSLLLRLVGEVGVDVGLPELLAFKISDTLGDRCEGDSMDIAGLLAIVDAVSGFGNELLSAVAAVVSPSDGDELEPSKSVGIKLDAFKREFGQGSLLVRFADDYEAAKFDDLFEVVWPIRNLRDLSRRLTEAGLIQGLNRQVNLTSEHGLAISTRMQHLLATESTFPQAGDFIRRVRGRIADDTPLRTKLDVSYAEEDLHRHTGNFDEAIKIRLVRTELENNPLISCYERMADSDNRHAAALYDAHRFNEAIDCLEPWFERFRNDPKICLPETRSFLLNTLGRCLVVLGDSRWEQMFEDSLKIQNAVLPGQVARTENFLIHGLLKTKRLEDASQYLYTTNNPSDPFRTWLRAEHARQNQMTWSVAEDKAIFKIDSTSHVFGFAIQAAARQIGRTWPTKADYFHRARDCFLHHVEEDKTNLKRLLSICCELAASVALRDDSAFDLSLASFESLSKQPSLSAIQSWYEVSISQLHSRRDWSSIESLFCRIPHL